MNLTGKTVLITGAAKRIGKAIALRFAERGCNVLLHYFRSETDAKITQSEIQNLGVSCTLVPGGLSDGVQTEKFIKRYGKKFEVASILVNSASIFGETPLDKLSPKEFQKFLDTNFIPASLLAQHIGLKLKDKKQEGVIINLTDARWMSPYPGYAAYFASKAALENLTHSLGRELAPTVRVNAVAPGAILFPEGYSDKKKEGIKKKIPLGRLGEPHDIANACVFLAQSDYVNGITLAVDGGRSLA